MRPDQASRQNIPLSPGGQTVAQLIANGLLTNADMVELGLSTATLQNTQMTQGIPPNVPNLKSANAINQSVTAGATVTTFAANSRIWGAHLSHAACTNASYTGANTLLYARLYTGSGITLTLVENGMGGAAAGSTPGQNTSNSDVTFNGIPVLAGDTVIIDINGGTAVGNLSQRASCTVLYSSP